MTLGKWKLLAGILVIAIPATLNFYSARTDSNEAKIRAEVAYTTQQEAVEQLLVKTDRLDRQVTSLKARYALLERLLSPLRPVPDAPMPAATPPPARKPFMDAVEQFKEKM